MLSFLEKKAPLRGYIQQVQPKRIYEEWKLHLEDKIPLEFATRRSLWTLEITHMHNSLVFGLELGFRKNGKTRWKTLTIVTVLYEVVLVDVVNVSNHALGLIIIRISDEMIFCHDHLMKNYDSVPEFCQVLMRDMYEKCDANVGNFIECANVVELYIKNAHTLHIAKLTSAFRSEDVVDMESEGKSSKKAKISAASSSGPQLRSRLPPASALPGAVGRSGPQPPHQQQRRARSGDTSPTGANPLVWASTPPGRRRAPSTSAPSSQALHLATNESVAHASPMQATPTQACRTSSVPPLDASTTMPIDPALSSPRPTARGKQKARKRKNPSNDARQSAPKVEPLLSSVRSIHQRRDLDIDNEAAPSSSTHETFTELIEEEAQRLAYKKEDGVWVVNLETVALNPTNVPEKLLVPMDYKPDARRSFEVEMRMRLKAEALANKEFKQKSSYMYISGRGQYFELDEEEMEPTAEESGIIVRPLEKKGVVAV